MKSTLRSFAMALTVLAIGSSSDGLVGLGTVTVIDFESQALGSFTTRTIGNLTISGTGANGVGVVSNDNVVYGWAAGAFNITGQHFANAVLNDEQDYDFGFSSILFTFANPVNGFAFNFGGGDNGQWTLAAYDSANNLIGDIEPLSIPSFDGGDYFGITGSGIASVRLINGGGNNFVVLDNLSFATDPSDPSVVPEPGSLMALGLLLASGTFFRSRRKAK
jgi:hypothetical protein